LMAATRRRTIALFSSDTSCPPLDVDGYTLYWRYLD
jgi:hypothetical protein